MRLPEKQKALLYPDRRALKGEGAANPALDQQVPGSIGDGERTRAYQPPKERSSAPPGRQREGEAGRADGPRFPRHHRAAPIIDRSSGRF